MDLGSKEQFGLNLPTPTQENQAHKSFGYETKTSDAEVKMPNLGAATSQNLSSTPAYGSVGLPNVPSSRSIQNNVVPLTTLSVVPTTADDRGLIEKDWVNKTKMIIASNHNDPYQLSKELTLIKADYMQKRYNKIIKLSE